MPLFGATAPRRAGRPRGARGAVFVDARALGIHHFAFLRGALIGVDLRAAFDRYLAWSETNTDLRHIQHRRDELLKQILEAGRRLDAARASGDKLTRHLEALRADAPDARTVALPSLDEWMRAERMDPDAWSEGDALIEYRAAHGIDNLDNLDAVDADDARQPRRDPARARVEALNHLQTLLATQPVACDPLDTWFARPVVIRLRNVGVVTLADLVSLINVYGHRWHDQVHGFGARRAVRVVAWLRSQQEALQLEIRASVDEPRQARALRLGVDAGRLALLTIGPRFALVPLEQLALPASLNGVGASSEATWPTRWRPATICRPSAAG